MSSIDDLTEEQMTEKPTSPSLLEDWYDDRYVTTRMPDYQKITEEYKQTGAFYNPAKHCICMDSSDKFLDFTGVCPCGRIKRELRDEKDFIRIRKRRFNSYNAEERKQQKEKKEETTMTEEDEKAAFSPIEKNQETLES